MIHFFLQLGSAYDYRRSIVSSIASFYTAMTYSAMKQRWIILLCFALSLLFATTYLLSTSSIARISRVHAQTAAQSPQTEADATIRWFTRWDAERIRTVAVPILAQFRQEHPQIRIALENVENSSDYYRELRAQFERSHPPDILYLATHVAYELNQQGALLPLDTFLQQDALNLSGYTATILDLYRNELGQLYCLPVDVATLAVIYNRELFAQAGLDYPQESWDWEDFLAVATAMTNDSNGDGDLDDATDYYGIDRFYNYWPLLIWSWTGHNIFDDPQSPTAFLLEEEDSVNALQWLADLQLQHGVMPPRSGIEAMPGDDDDLFMAGRAAMQITGYWQIPRYLAAQLDIDIAPLPTGEYVVNRNDGSCLAIADSTLFPDEAWAFLKFLSGPNGIGSQMLREQAAHEPAVTKLFAHSFFVNPLNLPSVSATDADSSTQINNDLQSWFTDDEVQTYPLYDPFHPIYSEWQRIAEDELDALWKGQRDADSAVGRMANAAEDLIEDLPTVPSESNTPVAHEHSTVDGKSLAQLLATGTLTTPLTSTPLITDILAPELMVTMLPLSDTPIFTTNLTTTLTSSEDLEAGGTNANEELQKTMGALLAASNLPRHYFVDPNGDDSNSGLHPTVPMATLQSALERVAPGDTIHLAAGDYFENVTTVTAGVAGAPITIMGPPDAILRGTGEESAAFYLTHNYYTLTGFTFDGLYGDPTQKDGYTQKLLYVQGVGDKEGVTGLRVLHMQFRNAGGECIRLRYFAQRNEIAYSTFRICGLLDFVFNDGGKNGEAIYIGTASDQWADGKNPTIDPDESSYNWIHHNEMDTQGNECVEVKEGGFSNVIEFNLCTGQLDPDSAGIGARGNQNVIRYNTIYGNVGAGIRLGGHEINGIQYGIDNYVYGNYLLMNIAGGVKIINEPQSHICGNYLRQNLGKQAFGASSEGYEPAAPC